MMSKMISQGGRCLLFYIFFMAVQAMDISVAYADFSFSGKKIETQLLSPESSSLLNPPPLIQCAQQLCADIPEEQTYASQVAEVQKEAAQSSFFDQNILPGLLEHRSKQQQELASLQGYVQFLEAQNSPLKFPEEFRNFYAFPKLTQRLMTEVTTTNGGWDFNGSGLEMDSLNLKGNSINAEGFEDKKKHGKLKGLSLEFASDYIKLRNTNSAALLSLNPLEEIIAIHGKGARAHILSLFQSVLRYLDERLPKDDPAQIIGLQRGLQKDLHMMSSYFETLTSVSSISNFSNEYLRQLSHAFRFSEIYSLIAKYDAARDVELPKDIPVAKLHELGTAFYKTTQGAEAFLKEESFTKLIGEKCRWKVNYLYAALPSEPELKVSKQNATRAIIDFQSWLFQSFSAETAAEIFNFLRDWQFFYPPSKQQFAGFLKDLTNPESRFVRSGFDPRLYAYYSFTNIQSLEKGSFDLPFEESGFNAFGPVLRFCEGLQLNPISDRVNSNGQVKLGWMTLRTPKLLESVVWHELAHTLSSLATGRHFNPTKSILEQNQKFHFSFESFDQFARSRQCVGEMQDQETKRETIYEPYLTWFKEGRLNKYKVELPDFVKPLGFSFSEDYGVETGSMHLRPTDRIQEILNLAANSEIGEVARDMMAKVYGSEALIFYDGVYVEEDWADLVAATIGRGKGNHFCYLTKGQENILTEQPSAVSKKTEGPFSLEDVPELVSTELNPKEMQDVMDLLKTPKYHSPLAYRLLHTEILRSETMPAACKDYLSEHNETLRIKKCDFF